MTSSERFIRTPLSQKMHRGSGTGGSGTVDDVKAVRKREMVSRAGGYFSGRFVAYKRKGGDLSTAARTFDCRLSSLDVRLSTLDFIRRDRRSAAQAPRPARRSTPYLSRDRAPRRSAAAAPAVAAARPAGFER